MIEKGVYGDTFLYKFKHPQREKALIALPNYELTTTEGLQIENLRFVPPVAALTTVAEHKERIAQILAREIEEEEQGLAEQDEPQEQQWQEEQHGIPDLNEQDHDLPEHEQHGLHYQPIEGQPDAMEARLRAQYEHPPRYQEESRQQADRIWQDILEANRREEAGEECGEEAREPEQQQVQAAEAATAPEAEQPAKKKKKKWVKDSIAKWAMKQLRKLKAKDKRRKAEIAELRRLLEEMRQGENVEAGNTSVEVPPTNEEAIPPIPRHEEVTPPRPRREEEQPRQEETSPRHLSLRRSSRLRRTLGC